MNIPNLASCHHFMRRLRSAIISGDSSGGLGCCCAIANWLAAEKERSAAATVALVPSNFRQSRRVSLFIIDFDWLLAKHVQAHQAILAGTCLVEVRSCIRPCKQ